MSIKKNNLNNIINNESKYQSIDKIKVRNFNNIMKKLKSSSSYKYEFSIIKKPNIITNQSKKNLKNISIIQNNILNNQSINFSNTKDKLIERIKNPNFTEKKSNGKIKNNLAKSISNLEVFKNKYGEYKGTVTQDPTQGEGLIQDQGKFPSSNDTNPSTSSNNKIDIKISFNMSKNKNVSLNKNTSKNNFTNIMDNNINKNNYSKSYHKFKNLSKDKSYPKISNISFNNNTTFNYGNLNTSNNYENVNTYKNFNESIININKGNNFNNKILNNSFLLKHNNTENIYTKINNDIFSKKNYNNITINNTQSVKNMKNNLNDKSSIIKQKNISKKIIENEEDITNSNYDFRFNTNKTIFTNDNNNIYLNNKQKSESNLFKNNNSNFNVNKNIYDNNNPSDEINNLNKSTIFKNKNQIVSSYNQKPKTIANSFGFNENILNKIRNVSSTTKHSN
jgi:hypothetical protein